MTNASWTLHHMGKKYSLTPPRSVQRDAGWKRDFCRGLGSARPAINCAFEEQREAFIYFWKGICGSHEEWCCIVRSRFRSLVIKWFLPPCLKIFTTIWMIFWGGVKLQELNITQPQPSFALYQKQFPPKGISSVLQFDFLCVFWQKTVEDLRLGHLGTVWNCDQKKLLNTLPLSNTDLAQTS